MKEIIAAASDNVLATLKIEHTLPFVPFPGLSVADNKNQPPDDTIDLDKHEPATYYTGRIVTVCCNYSTFVCQVEPHKMAPSNVLGAVIAAHYAWKVNLYFPELERTLEAYLDEQEKELAAANPHNDFVNRERYMFEIMRKKLKR